MNLPPINTNLLRVGDIKLAEARAKQVLQQGAVLLLNGEGIYSPSIRNHEKDFMLSFRLNVKEGENAYQIQDVVTNHEAVVGTVLDNMSIVDGSWYCTVNVQMTFANPLPKPQQIQLHYDNQRRQWR